MIPYRQLDLDWITPLLGVGGRFERGSEPLLADAGVRAVIDCRDEESDDAGALAAHGIALLQLPTPDARGLALASLWQGVEWVAEHHRADQRVLIHCQHGIGRSSLLCCCVLVASTDDAPTAALERAKRARSKVLLSLHQLESYRRWLDEWRRKAGARWRVPRIDELTAIAWRE